ncbi:MAG: DMT family transporter [Planctomycetota bacterium]|nr:DMT family transporter [Planctomycetota bacterium]
MSTTQPKGTAMGITTILLTLAGWTSIPLFLKYFSTLIDPWTANGWRYAISSAMWAPVLLWACHRRTTPKGLWRAALVPAIFNAAAQVGFGVAPYYIDPGLMTFSLRFQIVFVAIAAALMFPAERAVIRRPMFITGLVMVLAGTFSTILLSPKGLGGGTGWGVALAVASGLGYAGYALAVRKQMHGMNPMVAFAAVSQYTSLALVALMLILGKGHGGAVWELSQANLWFLTLSSIIGIGLGHTFYFFSISRLGLAVSAGVVQLQPITVSIASVFLFHEHLTTTQWITGVVAICGAALMLLTQHFAAKKAHVAPIDELDELPVDPDVAMVGSSNEPENGTQKN